LGRGQLERIRENIEKQNEVESRKFGEKLDEENKKGGRVNQIV